MELSSCSTFSKESLSCISENRTLEFSAEAQKIKEIHPRKIYYTLGNKDSRKFLVFSKESCFHIPGNGDKKSNKKTSSK